MTNGEKFKTAKERFDEFDKFCLRHNCDNCPAGTVVSLESECAFNWLELEYKGKEVLRPCPFCSGEAKIIDVHSSYILHHWIECTKCLSRTVAFCNKNEAIDAWNRRGQ